MNVNGGDPWALACVFGSNWSSPSLSYFKNAGQIVNNNTGDMNTATAGILLDAAKYVGTTNPRNGATGFWYAVPLSSDLVLSLANDPQTKALLLNNWALGVASTSGNPAFVTKDQSGGAGRPFIALDVTPEPATMVLLALGGLIALRRRSA